jgi:hypothetical protein
LVSPDFAEYTSSREDFDDKAFDEQNDLMSLAIQSETLLKQTESIYFTVESIFNEIIDYSKVF